MDFSNIKLVVSDMDGTLLDGNEELNSEFFEIHKKLKEKGIIFCAASGRPYYSLSSIFESILNDIYFISDNGSCVTYQKEELFLNSINGWEEFVDIMRSIPTKNGIVCCENKSYIENSDESFINFIIKYYTNYVVVDDLKKIKEPVLKFALFDKDKAEENLYPHFKHLQDRYKVVVAAKNWIDIGNKYSNKGVALKFLQNKLGIKKEETMVFGDYLNDAEMIQQAYFSFAMENAHPDLKKLANFQAKSHKEYGVLEILKEVIN